MRKLPTIEEANVIALTIIESVESKSTVQEQAFFIAGFQEAIKYLQNERDQGTIDFIMNTDFGGE